MCNLSLYLKRSIKRENQKDGKRDFIESDKKKKNRHEGKEH